MKSIISTETKKIAINPLFSKGPYGRLYSLDKIRGICIISMVVFHAYWDAVYFAGIKLIPGIWEYVWQQSTCICFILLSGICLNLSENRWERGWQILGASALVSAVTLIFMPEERIVFGVLTMLGSAMIIGAAAFKILERIPAKAGFFINILLFMLTKPINDGFLGIFDKCIQKLPQRLYTGYFATYLGFTDPGFFSSDYFSLMPWIFLFFAGFFVGRIINVKGMAEKGGIKGNPLLSWLGRKSLIVYLIHQPVIYFFVMIFGR